MKISKIFLFLFFLYKVEANQRYSIIEAVVHLVNRFYIDNLWPPLSTKLMRMPLILGTYIDYIMTPFIH